LPTASDDFQDKNSEQMTEAKPYQPKHKIRVVTAASLFDGHDAAINIMRRIIQSPRWCAK